MSEPTVALEIPSLLADAVDGRTSLDVQPGDIAGVCREIRDRWPALATLVLTERNVLREHVLILLNGKVTRHLDGGNPPVTAGDKLAIVQAVSGG